MIGMLIDLECLLYSEFILILVDAEHMAAIRSKTKQD
jgi:hypothetical protein